MGQTSNCLARAVGEVRNYAVNANTNTSGSRCPCLCHSCADRLWHDAPCQLLLSRGWSTVRNCGWLGIWPQVGAAHHPGNVFWGDRNSVRAAGHALRSVHRRCLGWSSFGLYVLVDRRFRDVGASRRREVPRRDGVRRSRRDCGNRLSISLWTGALSIRSRLAPLVGRLSLAASGVMADRGNWDRMAVGNRSG